MLVLVLILLMSLFLGSPERSVLVPRQCHRVLLALLEVVCVCVALKKGGVYWRKIESIDQSRQEGKRVRGREESVVDQKE